MSVEVVIDLGCRTYGPAQDSIHALAARYKPRLILGYDLHDDLPAPFTVGATTVIQTCAAAWVRNSETGVRLEGTRSRIVHGGSKDACVPTFDLAALVVALPPGIILKMDVEGAEYRLIKHLLTRGVADRIKTLIVEWHGTPNARPATRGQLERGWPTAIKEWWM